MVLCGRSGRDRRSEFADSSQKPTPARPSGGCDRCVFRAGPDICAHLHPREALRQRGELHQDCGGEVGVARGTTRPSSARSPEPAGLTLTPARQEEPVAKVRGWSITGGRQVNKM